MKKDELAEFAIDLHGVELDLTRPLKELRQEVQNLVDAKDKPVKAKPNIEIKFMRHRSPKYDETGKLLVYTATEYLLKNDELVACDEKGKLLAVEVEDSE
jgi:hypothetical protein